VILTLLGAPGSGKGTQGRRLAERLGLAYLSTGDLLRSAAARGTALGKEAKPYVDEGKLVPDVLLVPVVVAELSALTGTSPASRHAGTNTARGVVLDGFPRTREQAVALDTAGPACSVRGALLLRVPDEVVVNRLASRLFCDGCGSTYSTAITPPRRPDLCDGCDGPLSRRVDDSPETVRHRLALYARECQPLLEYYRHRGCLSEIDGNAPTARVQDALLQAAACALLEEGPLPFGRLGHRTPQPASFHAA
jgi:adenylate kinase